MTVEITLPDQSDTTVTAGLYASYGEKDYVILGRTLMSWRDSRDLMASRTHVLLTASSSVSCFSVGKRSPGFTCPFLIRSRMYVITWAVIVCLRIRLYLQNYTSPRTQALLIL